MFLFVVADYFRSSAIVVDYSTMSAAAAACVWAFKKMAEQSPLTGSADSLINEGIVY